MAHTPPQARTSRIPRRAVLCHGSSRTVPVLAFVVAAGVWPARDAAAQRACAEWSAEIATVEGHVEARRRDDSDWAAIASGERVCSGDFIRSRSSSRATITLPDGGILRLDENSSMALPEPPSGEGSLIELLRGVIHVISRDPRFLRFTTPYANAGLEGTEFDIRVDDSARLTEVVVLEGEVVVSTPAGTLNVPSDYIAIARSGAVPTATPQTAPIERMRWASYYPALLDGPLPAADQEPTSAERADADFFAHRAAARLNTARIEAAEADIASALRIAPNHAAALSVGALLSLARADRTTARTLLARALAGDPRSVAARIASSHVDQSEYALGAAERSLREALEIEPENSIVVMRLAEIALARGDTQSAIVNAERARSLAPDQSAPLVVLGFANLRRFETAAAEAAFADAIALEPQAPLPHLGFALASIQRGDLPAGRSELELAVALDPAHPLTRSYMAKVYAAENRGDLTASQLDLAKEFDPVDPTPWLYSSLQKLRSNRPVEALQDLRDAARKNGDRPIFRSWLPLDEDIATRSAGVGRVHEQLGFGRLALLDASRAVADDPTDFAAHRLLADGYAAEPRHENARVSELLVSQLLQPANTTPIKPQLSQQNLAIAQRLGPSHASFDELSSPVTTNGLKLRASAVAGTNGIAGDDVTLAGLHDRLSYSVGHYRFATDGFRANNELDQRTVNAFLQYRPGQDTNVQAELRSSRMEYGDLNAYFNRDMFMEAFRGSEDADSLRLGARHQLTPNHALLGSVIAQDVFSRTASEGGFSLQQDQSAFSVDLQDIARFGSTTVQSGIVAFEQDDVVETELFIPTVGAVAERGEQTNRQSGLYSYATMRAGQSLAITAGASLDSIELDADEEDSFSPKLGIVWQPTAKSTVRAAVFKTSYNDLTTSMLNPHPRIEPVQIAGFTQLIFGARGDEATVRGLAIDHELSTRLFVGWQADSRRTERELINLVDGGLESTLDVTLRERAQQAYLYWMPHDQISFSARYERSRYRSDSVAIFNYTNLKTERSPFEVRYFWRGGLTVGARATYVQQSGAFVDGDLNASLGSDRFWVSDAFVGYRLPNRKGLLSLNADNLLDKSFQFQDIDPSNPSLFPERLIAVRFTLAFD